MNIQEAAKEFFGVTTDYKEAGYLLPDGTMLDLSGKHLTSPQNAKYCRRQRVIDHRELGGENYDGFSLEPWIGTGDGDDLMCRFMAKAGAMRVDFNAHIASAIVMPTAKQIQTLYYGVRGSWLVISTMTKNGDLIEDVEFEHCSTKSITQWFKDHIEGQSSGIKASVNMKLTQFLNQRKVSESVQEALEDVLVNLANELKIDEDAFLTADYKSGGPQFIVYPYTFDVRTPVLRKAAKYFKAAQREMGDLYESIGFEATSKLNMSKLQIIDFDDGRKVFLSFKQGKRLSPISFEITVF